ncbi:unnamed protein product [Mytilus edulis]|uniref:Uncharacterized protein n=1 Tax=Mytilus edulis TaxID=6550 RepID=A0A8S3QC02_MYTED|nr:unnamed protein product [Mytilus edulis]
MSLSSIEEKGNLKYFSDQTWTTFKAAAESRNNRVSEIMKVLYKENETQVEKEPDSFTSAFDVLAKEVQQNIIHGLQVSNLTDLCSRFRELLLTQGVHVLKHNPTRLKARLVNEFGDNLTFWRSGRQNSLLVFCSSVPTGQIVQTAIESSTLVQSNNTLNAAVGKEDIETTVCYAAKAIRNVISLDSKCNIPWPPTGESISGNNIVIPDLLYNFLALLHTDNSIHASISPSKLDISSEVIDASPTDLNTVTTVLQRSVSIADKLGQRDVVIVFDQAIYAKALEIIWLL